MVKMLRDGHDSKKITKGLFFQFHDYLLLFVEITLKY